MLRGYHRIIVAAVGCLILVGASPSPQKGGEAEQAQGKGTMRQQPAPPATATPEANVAPSPDPGCEHGRDNRKSDLCAQWKAADAAFDAARWGWWQLILGSVGLVLGAVTMGAAIAAALYARRAAVATEETVGIARDAADGADEALAVAARNADAALKSNEIASATAERQLRAYVGVEFLGIIAPRLGQKPLATLTLKNFGQTPAHNFEAILFVHFARPEDEAALSISEPTGSLLKSLPPGANDWATSSLGLELTQAHMDALQAGEMNIYVIGETRYVDVFGRPRKTIFRGAYDYASQYMRYHEVGNDGR